MATQLVVVAPRSGRTKKTARPMQTRVSAASVVDRLYDRFGPDMARLAE